MPSEHSDTIGGSSAARVIACPGSLVLCQSAPPQTSSIYAQTGTALHDCMDKLIDPSIPWGSIDARNAHDFEGRKVNGVEITDKLIQHKLIPAVTWFKKVLAPDEWMIEKKCAFPAIPGAFGTVDVIYRKRLGPNVSDAGVADWKFGDGKPVHLKNNPQIQFYLRSAISDHPDFFGGLTAYRGHIFQPFFNPSMEKWQEEVFTYGQLLEFEATLNEAWALSRRNDPILNIGDHCGWCAAKRGCPKIRDVAAGVLEPRAGEPTAESYQEDMAKAGMLEAFVKELRKNAADFVRRGGAIPGWKLVDTLKDRSWVDRGEVEVVLRAAGLRVKDIYPKTLPTPAAAERAFKERGRAFDIATITTREKGGDKLVPDSAKGEPKLNRAALLKKVAAIGKARRMMR